MDQSLSNADAFGHIRVFIGLVTGLSVTRLLTGLAKFVQDPRHARIYVPHLIWTGYLFLIVLTLWWADLSFRFVEVWSFELYVFVLAFAALHFFVCVLLYPDSMTEWRSYERYFHARRTWFFSIIAGLMLLDLADTLAKGSAYFEHMGGVYPVRQALLAIVFAAAAQIDDRRFHFWLPVFAVTQEIVWIWARYLLLE